MTGFEIKVIISLCMVLDHLAAAMPDIFPIWFRVIGRFSFVGFAYLVSEGCKKSGNIKKYIMRLGILATVSEPVYDICFGHNVSYIKDLNAVWTLFMGAVLIYIFTRLENIVVKLCALLCMAAAAVFLDIDYGIFILLLMPCYFFFESKTEIFLSTAVLFTLKYRHLLTGFNMNFIYWLFSIAACILPIMYNGKRGRRVKYAFYIFYPLHLLIIAFIKTGVS